jgi:hypothetical protein
MLSMKVFEAAAGKRDFLAILMRSLLVLSLGLTFYALAVPWWLARKYVNLFVPEDRIVRVASQKGGDRVYLSGGGEFYIQRWPDARYGGDRLCLLESGQVVAKKGGEADLIINGVVAIDQHSVNRIKYRMWPLVGVTWVATLVLSGLLIWRGKRRRINQRTFVGAESGTGQKRDKTEIETGLLCRKPRPPAG